MQKKALKYLSRTKQQIAKNKQLTQEINELNKKWNAMTLGYCSRILSNLSLLLDKLEAVVYVSDLETYDILFINNFGRQIFGQGENLLGKKCYSVLQGKDHPCEFCTNNKLVQDGEPQVYVWEFLNQITNKWMKCVDYAVPWFDGRLVRLEIALNISDNKILKSELNKYQEQLESLFKERTVALKENKNRYEAIIKSLPVGVYQTSPEGYCVYTNEETSRIVGIPKENMIDYLWTRSLHPEDKKSVIIKWVKCVKKKIPFRKEVRIVRPDGNVVWSIALANPYVSHDGKLWYVGTIMDITGRKKGEDRLRLSNERFSKAFNASSNPMAIISLESGTTLDANEAFLTHTEYTKKEIIGCKILELSLMLSFDQVFLSEIREAMQNKKPIKNYELRICSKNRVLRYGLLSTDIIELNDEACMLVNFNDLTERRQMERELARLDRLNIVGQMAAGIGHEIRNPMTSVRGFLQLLKNKDECVKYTDYFNLMIEELDRANSIITEYLSLARRQGANLKMQNMNDILDALHPLIQSDANNCNVNLKIQKETVPDILLNEKELRQLILNLVRNGLDAMPEGGTLILKTQKKGKKVVLSVQDQGKGIAHSIMDKLGTPFVTTKDNGVGLGLATCYSIASRHKANIIVSSSSRGTNFMVEFKNS
ncbi:PAS/PAC sensor signal transduction histidine kinase [Desulforamulus reducens MI-1]|uniref:histidine kinase n=1 Tax=Desulforamulus reducens (strain ATCC BAA-1160 / DSM 100696 / MI-1) TaxID=349161 RepID=A4J4Q2_DESRM|nr:PAS domain-containing sensor histidine kinase [Desulforamulus reducens]ABO50055.1 PAS/PAC sensor signal transduction histidine kinase [Desulforamulus reducens MI-1]